MVVGLNNSYHYCSLQEEKKARKTTRNKKNTYEEG
ncbi:MAG: hypothetical protein ACJAUD_002587 [Crocinitomicaceae bacterium]|jgi:hypothetical protein